MVADAAPESEYALILEWTWRSWWPKPGASGRWLGPFGPLYNHLGSHRRTEIDSARNHFYGHSWGLEGFLFGRLRIAKMWPCCLLTSRISRITSKSMVLSHKRLATPDWSWVTATSGGVLVPQGLVYKWGSMCSDADIVPVCRGEESIVGKRSCRLTLTYGHGLWVVTETMRLWIQAVEGWPSSPLGIGYLGVEFLLLCIERSQLRWFRHLVRTPSRCLMQTQNPPMILYLSAGLKSGK